MIRNRMFWLSVIATFITLVIGLIFTANSLAQINYIDQPVYTVSMNAEINAISQNSDEILAVATTSGLVLYDATFLTRGALHEGINIRGVTWHPDGTRLALTVEDTVEIWDWDNNTGQLKLVTTLQGNGPMMNILWNPDGEWVAGMAFYGDWDKRYSTRINVWNTTTWQRSIMAEHYFVSLTERYPNILQWHPTEPTYLTGIGYAGDLDLQNGSKGLTTGFVFYVIDIETGERIREVTLPGVYYNGFSLNPDDTFFAVGVDGGISLYDSFTGELVGAYEIFSHPSAMGWSFDGTKLLADSAVLDIANGYPRGGFARSSAVVGALWNVNGETIIIAQYRGEIRIENPHLLDGYDSTHP